MLNRKRIVIYLILCCCALFVVIAWSKREKTASCEYLNLSFLNLEHPALNHQNVYLTVSTGANLNSVDSLIKCDLNTGKRETLFRTRHEEAIMQWTKVNDDWLVWVDASSDGYDESIMVMNLKNRSIKELSRTNPECIIAATPQLYKNYVVWIEANDQKIMELKLFNLKTEETKTIAQMKKYSFYNAFPYMGEGKVLWTDSINGKGYYFLYDLKSGKKRQYQAQRAYPSYAVYSNHKIFSLDFDDYTSWEGQTLVYLDLKAKKFYSLDIGKAVVNHFEVYQDQIAVLDENQQLRLYVLQKDFLVQKKIGLATNPVSMQYDQEGNLMMVYENSFGTPKIGVIHHQ